MSSPEHVAVGTICLMAAFADGQKSDSEQEKIKDAFNALGLPDQMSIYSRVLLRQTSLEQEASALGTPELRQLAFEMAVCVCDADHVTTPPEREFLGRLSKALGMESQTALRLQQEADSIVGSPVDSMLPASAQALVAPHVPAGVPQPNEAETDSIILQNSILCAGLELIPSSYSTLAILPLQMRMVHTIGKQYSFELDRTQIMELLAVGGVGMTSQALEGVVRKFLGRFIGNAGGHFAGHAAEGATGVVMTFATTFALGRIARIYYSSGRKLAIPDLKEIFQKEVAGARGLYGQYADDIRSKAQTVDPSSLLGLIRGK